MQGLNRDLRKLEEKGEPIKVGLVGAGQMGTDIISEVHEMNGMEIASTADIDRNRAEEAYQIAGYSDREVVITEDQIEANRAARNGKKVVSKSLELVVNNPEIDAVIESTGVPNIGAITALKTIMSGKHILMMTVETDVTVGPIIHKFAQSQGVVYSLAAGDEPSAIQELYDFADSLGFDVVAAGKGKNNPLDLSATPDDLAEEAKSRNLNPHMLVEFVDGSKTMIEMAAVANSTGLVPDVPGMHGPDVDRNQLKSTFAPKKEGGILNEAGVVDFAVGDVAPGVFLVVRTDHPRLRECLVLRDMGEGPNYLLFRPFHLCSMEVPLSVARSVIHGITDMAPLDQPSAEVVSIAKKDLEPGNELERIGGFTHYGRIDKYEDAKESGGLPLGLSQDLVVNSAVSAGDLITWDDVDFKEKETIHRLHNLQNDWLDKGVFRPDKVRSLVT